MPSNRFRKLTSKSSRAQSSVLIQLRSGHIPLNKYLHRIRKAESPLCPACHQREETVHHFLVTCPAWDAQRHALKQALPWGERALTMRGLLSQPKSLEHLLRFVGNTGRLRAQFGDRLTKD